MRVPHHVNTGGVGVAEQAPWSLRMYPNPVHDRMTVELPDNTEARLRVFDAMGQLVLQAVSHADRTELDLSGLQPGHYVVQVLSSEHAGTARILRW
ncbi:MAG: T9SS type A sorting domain-containing protein [Flavobacteriales bacterium]|nr:T9SS type A sorting domain-containing protein [Flavobacteriales bacterium]